MQRTCQEKHGETREKDRKEAITHKSENWENKQKAERNKHGYDAIHTERTKKEQRKNNRKSLVTSSIRKSYK